MIFLSCSWRRFPSGKLVMKIKYRNVKSFMFLKAEIISIYTPRQSKAKKSLQMCLFFSFIAFIALMHLQDVISHSFKEIRLKWETIF